MDYQLLANEITNNPKNIPDLRWDQSDKWIMDTLNTPGISGETTTRKLVNTADIRTVIYSDKTAFMAISELNLGRLNFLLPVGNVSPVAIQEVIKEIFPAPSDTRNALVALATRPASRAEKIPNLGAQSLSALDVHIARRL